MTRVADSREGPPTEASDYRFSRLRLGLVLHDMYFTKTDPSPGEKVPDFDLPTLAGDGSAPRILPKPHRSSWYSVPTPAR